MIDQTFSAQERAASDPDRHIAGTCECTPTTGSMKTMLEDQAAARLHQLETRRAELSTQAHNLSEALRNVRVARAEGSLCDLDRAIAELRAVVEGAG